MKKMIIGVIASCLLFFPQLVFAVEAAVYDSNGVTSFFGVYEEPVEESEEPLEAQQGNKQVNQKGHNILPATGSDHFNHYQISGLVVLLAVGMMLIKRRAKNEKKFIDSRDCIDEHDTPANNCSCS